MKTQKVLGIVIVLAMLFTFVGTVSAEAVKLDICHFDKDSGVFFMINISENAYDQHLAHGDVAPGDQVPGMPAGVYFNPDCSIPQKTLVDTVTVPSNGAIVNSTYALVSGVNYELEATGTYKFVEWLNAGIADARCSLRIPGSFNDTGAIAWIDGGALGVVWDQYLQIWVNGSTFEWGAGGCDTVDHTYVSPVTGTGTLAFKIVDNAYGDNVGSLTVKIYRYNW